MSADPQGALCVLSGLPGIGAGRLRALCAHHSPADALRRLAQGDRLHHMAERACRPDLDDIRRAAAELGPIADAIALAVRRCDETGTRVVASHSPEFPAQLVHDPSPPAALFVRGRLDALGGRRVGIVGTRNATAGGLATARELGERLAAHGVTVVSGLARGIDAAAHTGCRRGGGIPVAVVGCGPDVAYPRRNAELWEWVASAGLVVSEYPPGTAPDAWRFPRRNRILAALCEVLVVVESRERGGSLITAREALDRDVTVMAVPGSPRSRASQGTNQLLVDGAAPLTSVDDVLTALALDHRREGTEPYDPRPRPGGVQREVLDACRALGPATLDDLVEAIGLPVTEVALAAARLERSGWLVEAAGWFEPAESRLR